MEVAAAGGHHALLIVAPGAGKTMLARALLGLLPPLSETEAAAQYRPTPVDVRLADGERLDLAGGVRVIFTPGHTPGHIALFLERSHTLIAGDALRADSGRLIGPNPAFTPDPSRAAASVRTLVALDVAAIVCYHGGVVDEDASGQLRRVAEELSGA